MIDRGEVAVCSASGDDLSERATRRLKSTVGGVVEAPTASKLRWGAAWFCPADGGPLIDDFGTLTCRCGVRLPASFVGELVEFNFHRPDAVEFGPIHQIAGHGNRDDEWLLQCRVPKEPAGLGRIVFTEFEHLDPGYWGSWAFVFVRGVGALRLEWQWSYDQPEPPRRAWLTVATLEGRLPNRSQTLDLVSTLGVPIGSEVYWNGPDGSEAL